MEVEFMARTQNPYQKLDETKLIFLSNHIISASVFIKSYDTIFKETFFFVYQTSAQINYSTLNVFPFIYLVAMNSIQVNHTLAYTQYPIKTFLTQFYRACKKIVCFCMYRSFRMKKQSEWFKLF